MQTIVSKTSQKEFSKRELLLVDEKASITATLWGQQVEMRVIKIISIGFFRLGGRI